MHVEDIARINLQVISNLRKFKNNYQIFNIMNKKEYTNFEVMNFLSKILKIKSTFELRKINKKESINQLFKSGDDFFKIIKYKPKYTNLKKILKTNVKWFKKIF